MQTYTPTADITKAAAPIVCFGAGQCGIGCVAKCGCHTPRVFHFSETSEDEDSVQTISSSYGAP